MPAVFMKLTLICWTVLTLALPVNANPASLDINVAQTGYSPFPILRCPRADESQRQLLTQLNDLKTKIKSEAQCEEVVTDLSNVGTLMTSGRTQFLELTAKAQTTALTEAESESVKSYSEQMTKFIGSLTQSLGSDTTCFEEDRKQSSITVMTGLIGEVAKIGAMSGDPTAMTIAAGGQVLQGLMQGLENIRQNSPGYDFDKDEHRLNYTDSLCAYYSLYEEWQSQMWPQKKIAQLQSLKQTLENQVQILSAGCAPCRVIHERFLGLDDEQRQNWSLFYDQVREQIDETKRLYVNRLGLHITKSLGTLDWLNREIRHLDQIQVSGLGNSLIGQQTRSLGEFLIDQEGPRFIAHAMTLADQRWVEFETLVRTQFIQLKLRLPVELVQDKDGMIPMRSTPEYRTMITRLGLEAIFAPSGDDRDEVLGARWLIEQSYLEFIANLQVSQQFCEFFKVSHMYSTKALQNACNSRRAIEQVEFANMFASLQNTSGRLLTFNFQPKKNYSLNWRDSLQKLVTSWTQNPKEYLKMK